MWKQIDVRFGITAAGSTPRREVVGGVTTFATMSYIIFVQPAVLAIAGMDFGSVVLATCLASAAGCFFMGLLAGYPFALAPGMGQNFLFVFTVCVGMGFSWQAGLTIVLIAGLIFVGLSVFRTREKVLKVFPESLKSAIGPGIGLFIAFIGLQWGGITVLNPATMVALGPLNQGPPLITILGVLLIGTLMAYGFRGAILIGILATAAAGWMAGVIPHSSQNAGGLGFDTFFAFDFSELLDRWPDALLAIGLIFFLDLFDTVGTLVGVSSQAGFLKEDGTLPRAGKAFLADALASCFGACVGTSTVTSYVESATGVAAGARTGLASMVTGVCFLLALLLAPVVAVVGQDVGPAYYAALGFEDAAVRMYPAVAPALIIVGFLMLAPLRRIQWEDVTESIPAFLTIAMMVFGYGITEGIASGCISYAALKLTSGRWRDAHPLMYAIAVALVLRYAFML